MTDVERDATVLVKTFERPDALRKLVTSIRRLYPRIPILVVDDSAAPLDPVPEGVTRYFHLPYDTLGPSGGRNFGLRHVETEYVLVSDDDMRFRRNTDLRKLLHTLRTTRFDVVSCKWLDHDPWRSIRLGYRRFEGTAEIVDGKLVRRLGVASCEIDGLPVFDVVAQFFMAPVERLGEDPWDERLRFVEHVEFFLRLKERGLLSTRLPDVAVDHYPELPRAYYENRMNRAPSFETWSRSRGFDEKVWVGRWFKRRDRLVHYAPSAAAYAVRRSLRRLSARQPAWRRRPSHP